MDNNNNKCCLFCTERCKCKDLACIINFTCIAYTDDQGRERESELKRNRQPTQDSSYGAHNISLLCIFSPHTRCSNWVGSTFFVLIILIRCNATIYQNFIHTTRDQFKYFFFGNLMCSRYCVTHIFLLANYTLPKTKHSPCSRRRENIKGWNCKDSFATLFFCWAHSKCAHF